MISWVPHTFMMDRGRRYLEEKDDMRGQRQPNAMVTQTFWSELTQSAISPRILNCFNKQKYARVVHFKIFIMILLFVYMT